MSKTSASRSTVPPDEVASRRDDDLYVLDVRREDDFEEWHVEESHNLPIYDQLLDEDFTGLEAALDELPASKEIATVCVAGITSARAAEFLREHGYDARSMENGMRGWGRLHVAHEVDAANGVIQIARPGTGCLSYLVHDGGEAAVVDPSLHVDEYRDLADERELNIVAAVDTHAHADHVSGGRPMAADLGVPYYLHPTDAGESDEYAPMEHGDDIAVGDRELEVLHTPGHTPGSVSLRVGDALLSGDTLFLESVGRPDLEGNDDADAREAARQLFDSVRDLRDIPDETVVLPGHVSDEDRPYAATLGELEAQNELLGVTDEEQFIEIIASGLSDEPANYNEIKAINWGEEPLTEDAVDLELGPNNCAAN